MIYCEISEEMSSLYFSLAVFCPFEAEVPEFDTLPRPHPPHPQQRWAEQCTVHCTLFTASNSGTLASNYSSRIQEAQNTTTTSLCWSNNTSSLAYFQPRLGTKEPAYVLDVREFRQKSNYWARHEELRPVFKPFKFYGHPGIGMCDASDLPTVKNARLMALKQFRSLLFSTKLSTATCLTQGRWKVVGRRATCRLHKRIPSQ
jgi:hypothetical protein